MTGENIVWCVMDPRASYDIDRATIHCTCDDEAEARRIVASGDYGEGCVAVPFKEVKDGQ